MIRIGCRNFYLVQVMAGLLWMTACQQERSAMEEEEYDLDPAGVRVIIMGPEGNELRYDTEEIIARAGSPVRLIFRNVATNPIMKHNVVLVRNGDVVTRVGEQALLERDNEFIPQDDAIMAYTPLAGPGETVEMDFTVPPPGEYVYICTFPGHYVLMRGVLRSVE
jgi:azurin